jgi:diphosphoinositol-polyphosphate diphosphatase
MNTNPLGQQVLEVLMIRRGAKGWVFPKGGWESDEEADEAACREAMEEAGVMGCVEGSCLGTYEFQSGKADSAHKGKTVVYMYLLHVSEILDPWPEAGDRTRQWFSLQDASRHCSYQWMRDALLAWVQRSGWAHEAQRIASLPRRLDRVSLDASESCGDLTEFRDSLVPC